MKMMFDQTSLDQTLLLVFRPNVIRPKGIRPIDIVPIEMPCLSIHPEIRKPDKFLEEEL
jgi:hypothetical protein